jgi:DNA-binding NarL/FixJ family response regulator
MVTMSWQCACDTPVERLAELPRLALRVQQQARLACERATAMRATLTSMREQRAAALEAARAVTAARASVPAPLGERAPDTHTPPNGLDGKLTRRMRQILELLMLGNSEKEVASALRLSPHTVHIHVTRMYARLGVRSRAELLSLAYRTPPAATRAL